MDRGDDFMLKNLFPIALFSFIYIFTACFNVNITSAQVINYYVSPNGNDNNPGTFEKPFKSIKKACEMVMPGGTVYLRGGIYNENITIKSSGSEQKGYITITNYPGENPILDGSGLTVPNEYTGMIFIENKSFIRISGLEIRNYKTSAVDPVPVGIHIRGSANNIEIKNNKIHNIETAAKDNRVGNAHGIAVYGTASIPAKKITIEGNEIYNCKLGSSEALAVNGNVEDFQIINNYIHDNDNIGIAVIGWENTSYTDDQARNGIIAGNTVSFISSYGNPAYGKEYCAGGIYSDGARDVIIERNRVYNCDIGIEVASEHKGKSTSNISVLNNILYNNNLTGIAFGGYDKNRGSTINCKFINNTLYNNDTKRTGCGEVLMQFSTNGNIFCNNILYSGNQNLFISNVYKENNGNIFDYNIYYSVGGAASSEWIWKNEYIQSFDKYRSITGNDKHSKFVDPQFIDLSSDLPDFHIKEGSSAINAGDPANCAEYDFDGNKRNSYQGVDCGAYEFSPVPVKNKTYTLAGYIKCNVETKYPEINKGIKVEIVQTGDYTYTDSNGYFQLPNVPYNDKGYSIKISKQTYLTRYINDMIVDKDVVIGSKAAPVILLPGDINLDGVLSLDDIILISQRLNAVSSDVNYNPIMDLNNDLAINLEDIMIIAKNFGKKISDYTKFLN